MTAECSNFKVTSWDLPFIDWMAVQMALPSSQVISLGICASNWDYNDPGHQRFYAFYRSYRVLEKPNMRLNNKTRGKRGFNGTKTASKPARNTKSLWST